jgi:hypothetical protein
MGSYHRDLVLEEAARDSVMIVSGSLRIGGTTHLERPKVLRNHSNDVCQIRKMWGNVTLRIVLYIFYYKNQNKCWKMWEFVGCCVEA